MKKKMICTVAVLVLMLAAVFGTSCQKNANGTDGSKESENTEQTNSGNENTGALRVGFSRMEIIPKESVPMAGYGNTLTRMSEGALDYIYMQCIAVTDAEDETVLMFFLDAIGVNKVNVNEARKAISTNYGIPEDHITIAASHSHSGPDPGQTSVSAVVRYLQLLQDTYVEVAGNALNDRADAKMYAGEKEVIGLNFVRHYLLEDGTYAGDNFGHMDKSPIVSHETEADHMMRGLIFKRETKNDVFIANWQCHPTFFGKQNKDISPDFVGEFRKAVEKKLDGVYCVYAQGASGNINPRSSIASETPTTDYTVFGDQLSEYAVDIYNNMTEIPGTDVRMTRNLITEKADHSEDNKIAVAGIVQAKWQETNDFALCTKLANEYGLNSPYHANGIISKSALPQEIEMEINTIQIGEVGIVTAPFELFDTTAMYVHEHTPYTKSFVFGYSNARLSYLPTTFSYDNGCYERDVTNYARGTAEILQVKMVDLLTELKK